MRQFGGTWSETKLDCVERYVTAYLGDVDAFAGRGKQALKNASDATADAVELDSFFGDEEERADAKEFLVGSAVRALAGIIEIDQIIRPLRLHGRRRGVLPGTRVTHLG